MGDQILFHKTAILGVKKFSAKKSSWPKVSWIIVI